MSVTRHELPVYVGVDVGGTTFDCGAITGNGELVGPIKESESPSSNTLEEAVGVFANVLSGVGRHATDFGYSVAGYGIGIPGPFDYRRGVSTMRHKFQGLYGRDLKTPLSERLGAPVEFLKDAHAFALGVSRKEYPNEARLLCVTLGTGLGSAFVVDGQVTTSKADGVPNGGEIFNLKFKDGSGRTFEDGISKRRLMREYASQGGREHTEVKEIVERARKGESMATAVVAAYARDLGEALVEVSTLFNPTMIVFGGGIRYGLDVLAPPFEESYRKKRPGRMVPYAQAQLAHAAIYGAALHASRVSVRNLGNKA